MPRLALVHGYNHDPNDPEHSPAARGAYFDCMEKIFSDQCMLFRFPWYSGVMGRDAFKAWRHGHLTTYAWAYKKLAISAAERLAAHSRSQGTLDVVAHSLGTRVALQAVSAAPRTFRKVILLNGAETCEAAREAMKKAPSVDFLNIAVKTDDTVKTLGGTFAPKLGYEGCIGNGTGSFPDNCTEIILDDIASKAEYVSRGWDIRGNGPGWADHDFSYKHPPNWNIYKNWLLGTL